jgi:2-polyprenyl-3-methyl-5-hydroxy-6-metoxy-1,4-benzoquinol methylase
VAEPRTTFQQAVIERAGPGRSAQSDVWLDYILTTNERGAYVVAKVQEFVPSLRGRRLLDVGSGYGGVCVAAARAGAEAVGIEVDDDLRRLAALNLADAPGLTASFHDVDVLDWTRLSPLGRFDVVTCDNVIEHVASPSVLLAHARRLLEPDGLLYLTAPNAFSLGQIAKECHYGQFGLSLLDPVDGDQWVQEALHLPAYGVSVYFRLAEYERLLARYGLHTKVLNPDAAGDVVERVRLARRAIVDARAAAAIPPSLRAKVDRVLAIQLAGCDADVAFIEAMPPDPAREAFGHELQRVYLDELWYFVASPDPRRLHARMPRAILGKMRRRARAIAASATRLIRGRQPV